MFRRRHYIASPTLALIRARELRISIWRYAPTALLGLAVALVACALSDPRLPFSETVVQSRGVDIMMVLDLSSSMQEIMGLQRPPRTLANLTFSSRDSRPRNMTMQPAGRTRLDTTKEALKDFIQHRRDDRLGLVVFSDNSYIVSPLTSDHDYLAEYVDMVDDKILRGEGMTAIGEGVTLADYVLDRQASAGSRRSKVIIVFTDGENNAGRDPVESIQDVDAHGVRVHVVGVDLEEEVKAKPEVQRLISTVRRYGGRYYSAGTAAQLRAAYMDVDVLERGTLATKQYSRNTPAYSWLILPALAMIIVAFALRAIPVFTNVT